MRYDPLGRLYETSGGSAGITRFLYDGDELVGEYNASGTMLRRYAHGAGVDDPIVWYEGAVTTQPRFVHADYQGSIITVTDSAGTALGINRYDEYGIPASTNLGRFQYTGQAWLPELGLYYYKARLYSPTLGRFLQTDPIGYDDQFNLYAYVGGDPVNNVDPDGKAGIAGAILGGIVGAAIDYGIQVAGNLGEGKSWGDSLTQVDKTSIAISAGTGALAGATGVGLGGLANKALKFEKASAKASNARAKLAAARQADKYGPRRMQRLGNQSARAQRQVRSPVSSLKRAAAQPLR